MTDDMLDAYRTYPMNAGDAVVLIRSHGLATEIEGLADHWDPELCRNLARMLFEIDAREVQLAVARPAGLLLESDHSMFGDLVEELAGTGVVVRPLVALPAAEDVAV
jgi:hypothetical protein